MMSASVLFSDGQSSGDFKKLIWICTGRSILLGAYFESMYSLVFGIRGVLLLSCDSSVPPPRFALGGMVPCVCLHTFPSPLLWTERVRLCSTHRSWLSSPTEARTTSTIRLRKKGRATSPDVRTEAAAAVALNQVGNIGQNTSALRDRIAFVLPFSPLIELEDQGTNPHGMPL